MPKGADFICTNESCPNYGKKITVHGAFPFASIEDVMSLKEIVSDPAHYAALASKARNGEKTALIPYPNEAKINPKGIRLQYFLPEKCMVIDWDLPWSDYFIIRRVLAGENLDEMMSKKLGTKAISLSGLSEKGLKCPACSLDTKIVTWFTSTGVSNWGDPHAGENIKEE